MNKLLLILIVASLTLNAATPTDNISPDLRSLFVRLVNQDSSLVGREISIPLRLKTAKGKILTFSDAQIKLDENTTYEIARWQFDPTLIEPYTGKKDVLVLVRFRIDKIRTEDQSMPFFDATILSITDAEKK
jgi:hypothetical protein